MVLTQRTFDPDQYKIHEQRLVVPKVRKRYATEKLRQHDSIWSWLSRVAVALVAQLGIHA